LREAHLVLNRTESERKLSTWIHCSEYNIGNGIASFLLTQGVSINNER
jgi:hypothetical protein